MTLEAQAYAELRQQLQQIALQLQQAAPEAVQLRDDKVAMRGTVIALRADFGGVAAAVRSSPARPSGRQDGDCGASDVLDCANSCKPLLYVGDGVCDDGVSGLFRANFNCPEFLFDEMDCW